MKTIALRFSDTFAPPGGTIVAHQNMITKVGFVWYGKLGGKVSLPVLNELLQNNEPKILLIQSGGTRRYWAFIQQVSYEIPPRNEIPEYYRGNASNFSTWFMITKILDAPRGILAHCMVSSSKRKLSEVSKSSMNPYFIIEVRRSLSRVN